MKKNLLIILGIVLISFTAKSQTDVQLVNPGFETPNDSSKVTCEHGWIHGNDTVPFSLIPGFGWRVDSCADEGREQYAALMKNIHYIGAYDGIGAMYSHNKGRHIYQVVGDVPSSPATLVLDAMSVYSYSDGDTAYTGLYISLFSGTDTTKRTIVAGDSVEFGIADIKADTTLVAWTEGTLTYTTSAADVGKHICIEFGNSANTGSYTYFYHDGFTLTTTGPLVASVKTNKIAQFEVYPNPSSDGIFKLKNIPSGSITVSNIIGDIVYLRSISTSNIIDLSSQPKGVYIIKVHNKNLDTYQKVVIR